MSLRIQLQEDQKTALKCGDKRRLGVLRLMLAGVKQIEVDERKELSDQEVLAVLEKMTKQRRDSARQFRDAGRQELVDQEEFELSVIAEYLPEQLSESEVSQMIDQAIIDTGASSMKDMGSLMAGLKEKLQGRADMGAVSKLIRLRLQD